MGTWNLGNLETWELTTSQDKKITKPLGTKKNHHTSRDKKKSPNLAGQKKINQTLGSYKIKKTIVTKINHPTSRDKKITQPLGTKNITQPLGTKENHPTSWDKTITRSRQQK
jgi:hypothetical protein